MVENVTSTQSRRRHRRTRSGWLDRALWLEPFWLLLLSPSLLFTEYFWDPAIRPLLIVALFLFWPLRLKAEKPILPHGPIRWLLGFLLLWIPVTIWVSANDTLSWEIAGYLYLALVSFVTLVHWPPLQRQPGLLVVGLLLLGMGLAIVGPEHFSVEPDKILDLYQKEEFQPVNDVGRIAINPNILGAALALILTLSIALVLRRDWIQGRWIQKRWIQGWLAILLIMSIVVMGNSLIISQNRSGWLALLIAGIILSLLLGKRWFALLLISTMIIGGATLWSTDIGTRLPFDRIADSTQESFTQRQEIWRFSLEMVASNPLTGIGLGVYEQTFAMHFPSSPKFGGRLAPPHAHNLWLQVALDLGLPGFIAWAGLWLELSRRLLRSLSANDTPLYALRMGVLATFITMVVIGCFDNALWGTKLTFLPWIFFALAYITSREWDRGRRTVGSGQ